jgi:hypothetical protein
LRGLTHGLSARCRAVGINLIDRQVEVYTGPSADNYSSCIIFKPGQSVPVAIDGVEVGEVAVVEILPRIVLAAASNGA